MPAGLGLAGPRSNSFDEVVWTAWVSERVIGALRLLPWRLVVVFRAFIVGDVWRELLRGLAGLS